MVTTKKLIDNLITANAKHIAELTTEEDVKQWLNSLLWAVAGFKQSIDEEELDSLAESCCIEDEGELYSTYLDGFKAGYRKSKKE